uniref:Uncharacterized protein n=1 Tax=Anguilla anguilla TaxID=7936 RepID=A0A0E9W6E9_ANGAN
MGTIFLMLASICLWQSVNSTFSTPLFSSCLRTLCLLDGSARSNLFNISKCGRTFKLS